MWKSSRMYYIHLNPLIASQTVRLNKLHAHCINSVFACSIFHAYPDALIVSSNNATYSSSCYEILSFYSVDGRNKVYVSLCASLQKVISCKLIILISSNFSLQVEVWLTNTTSMRVLRISNTNANV